MTTLETDRLTIRNFRSADWRDLHEMIVGYQASEYAQYDHKWPTSEQEIQGVTDWFASGDSYLAVCLRDTGKVIGFVALVRIEDALEPTCGLGYVFNFDYHRQGYATEACRAAIDHAFGQLGMSLISTGTAPENLPSRGLLGKLGLRLNDDGMYTLTRTDWATARPMEA